MKKVDQALALADSSETIYMIQEMLFKKVSFDYDNITRLNEPEQFVLCIGMIEGEVNNGGFDQFFFNSSGDHAYQVLDACRAISAHVTAALLEQAIAHFPTLPIPKDTEIRREAMENTSEAAKEKWDSLDGLFYDRDENTDELLVEYIKKHRDSFD